MLDDADTSKHQRDHLAALHPLFADINSALLGASESIAMSYFRESVPTDFGDKSDYVSNGIRMMFKLYPPFPQISSLRLSCVLASCSTLRRGNPLLRHADATCESGAS